MSEVQSVSPAAAVDPQEVSESVTEMLDALLDANPHMLEVSPGEDVGALEGIVEIVGGASAMVKVHCELMLGRRLAVGYGLVDESGEPSLGDALEAFSEFVNLMGGSVKLLIDAETSLGIPSVSMIDAETAGVGEFVIIHHALGALAVDLRIN